MKLSRELKTGIIVIGGILLFIMGFSYLKSSPIFDNSKTFYAVYANVGGLQPGTSVSINGFNVGKVNDIKFLDAQGNLLVTFTVGNEFKFSKNSVVELYDTGIIGGKGLQIKPVFDATGEAQSGDTLTTQTRPGITDLAQQKLTPLVRKFESAISGADSVLVNVNSVLDTETKKELKEVIVGLNDLIVSLNGSASSLNSLLNGNKESLDNSLQNFEKLTTNFANLSDSLNAAGLGETLTSLKATLANLNEVTQKIESGDGTLGMLMTDKELYNNLNNSSKELDLLLQDFRLNPKRYVNVSVFGKKQKEYTVPEDDPAEKIEE
ncbi:phospholipid/cholesterol/gamma-HCH transport system substrate-binding protein [Maribacter sedimenticola]|uniref:Phospholipid/cholesterol/gamma-HCH transport system substrate-binding protein n=1 Tax=Maribacter sedimenticola TaxID=228956 RepID=A0ABY1SJZ1_9FLAO|nr:MULTISPECIES: MlaD family protein [Maribacter]TVZ13820.1 phospholipid/cholesterol/gamma-HCH transport system substrate-binding protein [Maribacter sp. MAR_2009_72]SNR67249.1 phospholipid/cholesterol/gamma-HCH transport system substrate-binding protein [Maribacter sedimenticola]